MPNDGSKSTKAARRKSVRPATAIESAKEQLAAHAAVARDRLCRRHRDRRLAAVGSESLNGEGQGVRLRASEEARQAPRKDFRQRDPTGETTMADNDNNPHPRDFKAGERVRYRAGRRGAGHHAELVGIIQWSKLQSASQVLVLFQNEIAPKWIAAGTLESVT